MKYLPYLVQFLKLAWDLYRFLTTKKDKKEVVEESEKLVAEIKSADSGAKKKDVLKKISTSLSAL